MNIDVSSNYTSSGRQQRMRMRVPISNQMIKPIAIALFVCAAATVQPAMSQDCTATSVRSCQSAFNWTMQTFKINSIVLDDVTPSWNLTILEPLCQNYNLYYQCMKPIIPHCSTLYELASQGVDDAWHYMCDNSSEEFLNFSSCFGQPYVRAAVNFCNDTLAAKIQALQNRNDRTSVVNDYCSYYDNYLSCLSKAVEPKCGIQAANWTDTYVRLLLEPTLSSLPCPGWEYSTDDPDWSQASIVIAVFIGITLFLMVVIIAVLVILVLYRRRQQQLRSSSYAAGPEQRNSNDPPSYCEPYVVYQPATSDAGSDGNASGDGVAQFRLCYVDPLTGLRRDGELIDEADLPYKVCPSLPPPYAERPPPSFEETFADTDSAAAMPQQAAEISAATGCENPEVPQQVSAIPTATGIINEAFTTDDNDVNSQNSVSQTSTQTAEHSSDLTHL